MKVTVNIKKRYAYAIIGLLIFAAGVFIVNALQSPDPGHGADQVGPGTFSGSSSDVWTFPGRVEGEGTVPTGAVMFFNLAECPPGWSELTDARGRYLVGLPTGGTLAGSAGIALSDLEDRPVGQHTHSITDPGHQHTSNRPRISGGPTTYYTADSAHWHTMNPKNMITDAAYTGITINPEGDVNGTNAPYIQLLVCQKD